MTAPTSSSTLDTLQAPENLSFPPSPSEGSIRSESDMNDGNAISRQSPSTLSLNQSPSSSFVSDLLFQKPEFLQNAILDSESSSRSSLDSHFVNKDSTADKINKFRESRECDPDNSSDSSSSEESLMTAGTASIDGEDIPTRKGSSKQMEPLHGLLRPADAPRGRLANIRRESYSSVENELAHERLVKVSQRVSVGWEEFKLNEKPEIEEEQKNGSGSRRTSSVSEPISIMTNAFLPHSCSPSPTRIEIQKQCYSPSTQQIVRANIPYSPSPSPTRSPSRQRIMRLRSQSPSPIAGAMRSLKRRLNDPLVYEKDSTAFSIKRTSISRTATSPLVNDKQFPFPLAVDFTQPQNFSLGLGTPISSLSNSFGPPMMFGLGRRNEALSRRTSIDSLTDDKSGRDIENDSFSEPSSVPPHGEGEEPAPMDESQMDIDVPNSLQNSFTQDGGQTDLASIPCVFGPGYMSPPLSTVGDSTNSLAPETAFLQNSVQEATFENNGKEFTQP